MKIQNKMSIDRLARGFEVELDLSAAEDKFLAELLEELNEGITQADYDLSKETPRLLFSGKLCKLQNEKYEEYLLLEGHIQASFFAICVGSGIVMLDSVEAQVKAVIVDEKFESLYSHEEDTTLYIEEDEYDLYYFDERGEFKLKEILSEYLFLNKDPYPKVANFTGIKTTLS